MKIFNKWENLLYSVIILLAIIFLIVGYLFGYYHTDKSCIENPLSYGIEKVNKISNANFTCSCVSFKDKPLSFVFDETGIKE